MIAWGYDKGRKEAEMKPSEREEGNKMLVLGETGVSIPRGWGRVQDSSLALQTGVVSH